MKENDPADQLLTVLDVLWEELQWRTQDADADEAPVPPSEDEINAALWQIHELVFAMAAELDMTYARLEDLARAVVERERVRNVLFGPDGERIQ